MLSKKQEILKAKAKGGFGIAELYWIFQRIGWDMEQFEDLLENVQKLMQKVPTDVVVKELFYKMPPGSPITRYKNRIQCTYKKRKGIVYKPEAEKEHQYSMVTLAVMPFALVVAYSVGVILEFKHFAF